MPSGLVIFSSLSKNSFLFSSKRYWTVPVEYMMSNIIIADAVKAGKTSSLVFYFGEISESNMSLLVKFLSQYQRIEKNKPLLIYYYDKSDTVLDVINSYKNKDDYKNILDFRKLAHYSFDSEPQTIANDE